MPGSIPLRENEFQSNQYPVQFSPFLETIVAYTRSFVVTILKIRKITTVTRFQRTDGLLLKQSLSSDFCQGLSTAVGGDTV